MLKIKFSKVRTLKISINFLLFVYSFLYFTAIFVDD